MQNRNRNPRWFGVMGRGTETLRALEKVRETHKDVVLARKREQPTATTWQGSVVDLEGLTVADLGALEAVASSLGQQQTSENLSSVESSHSIENWEEGKELVAELERGNKEMLEGQERTLRACAELATVAERDILLWTRTADLAPKSSETGFRAISFESAFDDAMQQLQAVGMQ